MKPGNRRMPGALLAVVLLGGAAGAGTVALTAHGGGAQAARTPPGSTRTTSAHPAASTATGRPSSMAPSGTPGSPAAHSPTAQDRQARINGLLARMSLEDKVGQLFVSRVYGGDGDHPAPADAAANRAALGVGSAAEAVARYRLGGVVYFGWTRNLGGPEAVARLSGSLQSAAARLPVPVPLLIATDQEQGAVVRIGPPATGFPGAMALGAAGRSEDAATAARVTGEELAALGVNQDYAPVADVNVDPANPVIGIRSFGSDPAAVAALTAAQVDGFHRAGTAATAKHFPGHGDTSTDSHTGLPVITHSRAEWERIDAPPFAAAVRQGVDSIMTAHIVVPALDPSGDPATLSHPILTGLLRERLGYRGVIITDSLDMAGVRQRYGDARVPVLALKAGADQLLNPPDLPLAYRSVLTAVRDGELTQRRIDASVSRILRLKLDRGLFDRAPADPAAARRKLGTPDHLAAAEGVADRSITLLRNEGGLLPLAVGKARRVLVTGWEAGGGADGDGGVGTAGGQPVRALTAALSAAGHPAVPLPTGDSPDAAAVARAVSTGRALDAVVVLTNQARNRAAQQRLVAALLATGRPVVQVAVHDPHDLARLPGVKAALATYSWSPVSMRALARVLTGQTAPTGRLPVAVPGPDGGELLPRGYGLHF